MTYPFFDGEFPSAADFNQLATKAELNLRAVSVLDYGADKIGVADSSPAWAAAIAALPATGGTIYVPQGNYLLNTDGYAGSSGKNIIWMIDPGATFSGTGIGVFKFPAMSTNGAQIAVGPYIRCQSSIPSPAPSGPGSGGIGAWNVEMIQPLTYVGYSVAAYIGAEGSSSNVLSDVWAANLVLHARAGAAGVYQGIELDCGKDTSAGTCRVHGFTANGGGTFNCQNAFTATTSNSTSWDWGFYANSVVNGLRVVDNGSLNNGVWVGNGGQYAGSVWSSKNLANGGDGFVMQRFTETSPTGFFFRFVKADNSGNIATWDVNGNLNMVSGNLTTTGNVSANIITSTGGILVNSKQVQPIATQSSAPTTGSTITIGAIVTNYINTGTTTLAALTITLPSASLKDGQTVQVTSASAITTLTVNGGTTVGAPTTLAANSFFTMMYLQSNTTWYRIA